MASPATIAVIGSLNIDFITRTPRLPHPGETLSATSFTTGFGGKGANQAVACARLSPLSPSPSPSPSPDQRPVRTRMQGRVGTDTFGRDYVSGLGKESIDAGGVAMVEGQRTGAANIIVDEGTGENRILFAGNANLSFTAEERGRGGWDLMPEGMKGGVVVLQLEVPMEVVLHNMRLARAAGSHVIFNPAPASPLPEAAYADIDTLIMNETESQILWNDTSSAPPTAPEDLAAAYLSRGVRDHVIVTLGGAGVAYATAGGAKGRLPAEKVAVVDTTAAGDTFVGGFAVRRAQWREGEGLFDVEGALKFATRAAAVSVGRNGAMDAIPYLKEVGGA